MKSPVRIFLGLLLGALLGYVCGRSQSPALHRIPMSIEPLGRLFINAIRVCVIPLVTASLIAGCAATTNPGALGRLAARSLAIILSYLAAAAVFAGTVSFPLFRYLSHITGHVAPASALSVTPATPPTFAAFVVDLIPANVFKAAADGALLPLVLFSVGLGIAISRLPEAQRETLTHFFRALANAFTMLIGAILTTAPVGVFCLSVGLASSVGLSGAGSLLGYVGVLSLVSGGFIVVILYPSVAVLSSMSVVAFIRASAPAQAIAFTSRSSLAALPATYKAAHEGLGLPDEVSGFFFPFAASIFRVGGCMAQMVGVCFLASFYGVPLSAGQLAALTFSAVAVSMTVPGIPGGAIIVMTPMLTSVGVPLEGMAMLLAVDTIPDMFRTAANVSAWLGAATLLIPRVQAAAESG